MLRVTPTLAYYLNIFANLHRNQNPRWGAAPHKPILLLAVLDEIERGNISQNLIELTPALGAAFRAYWRALVPPATWQERIANPFRFLVQESFWTLVKNGVAVNPQGLGYNPTISQLTTEIDGATLDPPLWKLLQDRANLATLRTHLLKVYFGEAPAKIVKAVPANPIDYEVERLIAEAKSKFKVKIVSEAKDEVGYYIRHSLFPGVVKRMYDEACAVCALRVRAATTGGIVDAAHIMPFYAFHNDDPRNGIALCKNHHRGFDAGWFSITDDYTILVSPSLE